jgi:hypothetical protein
MTQLNKLIVLANEHCKKTEPDYDEDFPIKTIEEAIAVLVVAGLPHDVDISGEQIYDYLTEKK